MPPVAAATGSLSVSVTSLYSVSLPPGSWDPVAVAVTNRGPADVQGQLVVTSPVFEAAGSPTCWDSPSGTLCTSGSPGYALGGYSSTYAPLAAGGVVTYRSPINVFPGTTKEMAVDVLVPTQPASVRAEVLSRSGGVLAKASGQLSVSNTTAMPAILIVSNDPTLLATTAVPMPDGPQPQVQVLAPTLVPGEAAALSAFAAIVIDQADTSGLSAAQSRAVQSYVDSGGTLVLAGGLGWRGVVAGLPPALVPVRVGGTIPERLRELAAIVGAPAPVDRVDVDDLTAVGGTVILSEGSSPLAVEATRGSGHVVVSTMDPAAPPLSTWAGGPALWARLLAPAYQSGYFGSSGGAVLSGALTPVPPVPLGVLGQASGQSALMSPTSAGGALAMFLEAVPGASLPSEAFLGLLLLGYVTVAGPVCFLLLRRLRKAELAWVALPCLAVACALVGYLTGAGMDRSPVSDEIRVAFFSPGSQDALVSSLGAAYLPRGGPYQVVLDSSGPLSDLGAGAGATLTITPGAAPGTSTISVIGANNSLGGWVASEEVRLTATLTASVQESSGVYSGRVANHLGTTLTEVHVVSPSGDEVDVGALAAGATASFHVPAPSPMTAAGGALSGVFLADPSGSGLATFRSNTEMQGLYELAAQYATTQAAGPVLVGIAKTPFLAPDEESPHGLGTRTVDAVMVPLAPLVPAAPDVSDLVPELVGAGGVMGETSSGSAASSFVLRHGGFFDYQFSVPVKGRRALDLDLGAPLGSLAGSAAGQVDGLGIPANKARGSVATDSGARRGDFSLSAFNYATGTWAPIGVPVSSGVFQATLSHPAPYIGPGGTVEFRLRALGPGLQVFGAVPTLSTAPAGS
jgi:hypothetical protein